MNGTQILIFAGGLVVGIALGYIFKLYRQDKQLSTLSSDLKALKFDNFRRHEHLRVLLTNETPVININNLDEIKDNGQ